MAQGSRGAPNGSAWEMWPEGLVVCGQLHLYYQANSAFHLKRGPGPFQLLRAFSPDLHGVQSSQKG